MKLGHSEISVKKVTYSRDVDEKKVYLLSQSFNLQHLSLLFAEIII